MPFNGQGIFQRVYQWVNDASNNIFVDATRTDTDSNDIADGLSNCVTRDGQSSLIANLPMGGFKLTGLGPGQAAGDSVNFSQAFTAPSFTGGVAIAGGLSATGAINFTNASSVTGPTPLLTDNSNTYATTSWVSQKQFNTSLPAQTGNGGKFITTDGTNASWANPLTVFRSARTANISLGVSDMGTLIDVSSFVSGFTQTFAPVATLGSGWYVWIRNSGLTDIVLNPNASELIDGLLSYPMYPGEVRLIQCDGTALRSLVLHPFSKTFISSGTFTKPPGYLSFEGEIWGGGGSGAATIFNGASAVSGAGGAACIPFSCLDTDIAATVGVTIGAGGVAVSSTSSGNQGGNSTFNGFVAYGGGPGTTNNLNPVSGGSGGGSIAAGNTGSTSDSVGGGPNGTNGDNSGLGGAGSVASTSVAGNSAYGGAAGGGAPVTGTGAPGGKSHFGGGGGGGASTTAGLGGVSTIGGNGGAAGLNAAGTSGVAPGGGGGASRNVDTVSRPSGAGARGELRIRGKA